MGSSVWKALPWGWLSVTCFSVRKAVPVLLRPPPVLFLCRNLVHSSGSATASRFQNADLGDGKRCSTVRWSSPRSRIVGQPVCLRTNRRVQLTLSLSSRVRVASPCGRSPWSSPCSLRVCIILPAAFLVMRIVAYCTSTVRKFADCLGCTWRPSMSTVRVLGSPRPVVKAQEPRLASNFLKWLRSL